MISTHIIIGTCRTSQSDHSIQTKSENNLKNKLGLLLAIGVLCCTLNNLVHAQEPVQIQHYPIPGHGILQLNTPKEWKMLSKSLEAPPSAMLKSGTGAGAAFNVQITSVWLDSEKLYKFTNESIKSMVQRDAEKLLPSSIEKSVQLMELKGKESTGYYFSLTDQTPSSTNNYQYLTQGTIRLGDTLTIFTLLHREPTLPEKNQLLRILVNATYIKSESAVTSTSKAQGIQINTVEQSYQISVPQSSIILAIPKGGMSPAKNTFGGSANNSRYFFLADDANQIAISGWFEPEQRFRGVKSSWESDTAEWSRKGLPTPQDISFQKIDNWDAIIYDMAVPVGSNSHARAHLLQAGTWIDMHISLTERSPSVALRVKLLALLRSIQVIEKPISK